jgi:hypothetical protein
LFDSLRRLGVVLATNTVEIGSELLRCTSVSHPDGAMRLAKETPKLVDNSSDKLKSVSVTGFPA